MNKVIAFVCVLLAAFLPARLLQAAPSWAAVYSLNCSQDKDVGSEASVQGYSGYLCTAAAAREMFGGATSADAVTAYLRENFASVAWDEQPGVKALASSGLEDTQYALKLSDGTSYSSTDYIAVLLYASADEAEAFRVFGAGSAERVGTSLVFDDQENLLATETVGAWTTIPEPTSALLLLFGLAALSLTRPTSKLR